jgi:hypothetical protein
MCMKFLAIRQHNSTRRQLVGALEGTASRFLYLGEEGGDAIAESGRLPPKPMGRSKDAGGLAVGSLGALVHGRRRARHVFGADGGLLGVAGDLARSGRLLLDGGRDGFRDPSIRATTVVTSSRAAQVCATMPWTSAIC